MTTYSNNGLISALLYSVCQFNSLENNNFVYGGTFMNSKLSYVTAFQRQSAIWLQFNPVKSIHDYPVSMCTFIFKLNYLMDLRWKYKWQNGQKQTQMGMTMTVKRVTHYFETEPYPTMMVFLWSIKNHISKFYLMILFHRNLDSMR